MLFEQDRPQAMLFEQQRFLVHPFERRLSRVHELKAISRCRAPVVAIHAMEFLVGKIEHQQVAGIIGGGNDCRDVRTRGIELRLPDLQLPEEIHDRHRFVRRHGLHPVERIVLAGRGGHHTGRQGQSPKNHEVSRKHGPRKATRAFGYKWTTLLSAPAGGHEKRAPQAERASGKYSFGRSLRPSARRRSGRGGARPPRSSCPLWHS